MCGLVYTKSQNYVISLLRHYIFVLYKFHHSAVRYSYTFHTLCCLCRREIIEILIYTRVFPSSNGTEARVIIPFSWSGRDAVPQRSIHYLLRDIQMGFFRSSNIPGGWRKTIVYPTSYECDTTVMHSKNLSNNIIYRMVWLATPHIHTNAPTRL